MAFLPEVRDFDLMVVEGDVPGYRYIHKFGRNPDIDTGSTPEDVWGEGGLYTGFPTGSAETVTVVSSSVLDTAAGTGARTVRLSGLNGSGAEQTEEVTLNGIINVTTINSWTRLNRVIVLTAGAGGANAGTITVRHSVTVVNIFAVMPIGLNQTLIAAYTIPAGYTGYVRQVSILSQQAAASEALCGLWTRENGSVFRNRNLFDIATGGQMIRTFTGGLALPALTDIVIRVNSVSANNTAVSAYFDILLSLD